MDWGRAKAMNKRYKASNTIFHFLLQKLYMRCPNKPICASSSLTSSCLQKFVHIGEEPETLVA
jgi:hypothetical protein